MPVRQILNRCDSPRMPFRWTINPYRGCEFGCVYCYARYTHDFLELRDPMDFERKIFVKRMAAEVLSRTLSRTPIGTDAIAIGTATDPYQPAERKYGLTRSMLEVFAQLSGLDLSITTKSSLIVRDLELLRKINRRSKLSVNFSLITLDRQAATNPRAARAASGTATPRAVRAGARRNPMQRADDADDTGPHRRSRGNRERDSRGASRECVGRMVAFAVSETRSSAPLHSIREGAFPAPGRSYRHVLRPRRVCSERVRRPDAHNFQSHPGAPRLPNPRPLHGATAVVRSHTAERTQTSTAILTIFLDTNGWQGLALPREV